MKKWMEELEPKLFWREFHAISQIPRGSGNETAILEYIKKFAKARSLAYKQDSAGNLLVEKTAEGVDDKISLCLQGHVDMICEKIPESTHDFTKDPLELILDGEYIRANGTTLGSDNGFAVAMMLAILDGAFSHHPHIEALFTVDEERGLAGVQKLDLPLRSQYLLNMDADGDELIVGCSGMAKVCYNKQLKSTTENNDNCYSLQIGALSGGHSGMDITTGRANALKLLSYCGKKLANKFSSFRLRSFNGGKNYNVIPRDAELIFSLAENEVKKCQEFLKAIHTGLCQIFEGSESEWQLSMEKSETRGQLLLDPQTSKVLLASLLAVPDGVGKLTPGNGKAQFSTNFAIAKTTDTEIELTLSIRDTNAYDIEYIGEIVDSHFQTSGFSQKSHSYHGGWSPDYSSTILDYCQRSYRDVFKCEPEVGVIHAGLECGMIKKKFPQLDMVAIGVEQYDIHTPQERLALAGPQRVWDLVENMLKRF